MLSSMQEKYLSKCLVGPRSCLSSCFPGGGLAVPAEAQQQTSGNSFCREGSVFNRFHTFIWRGGVADMFGVPGLIFRP